MFVALAMLYTCYRLKLASPVLGWPDVGFLLLEGIFFATSRDTLRKYYVRSAQLLPVSRRGKR